MPTGNGELPESNQPTPTTHSKNHDKNHDKNPKGQ